MSKWFTHLKLYRRINLRVTYKTLSPLRIGSSKGKSLFSPVDLQVIRIMLNGRETPYIPGSSLKGVFRSTVETLLKSYSGLGACDMGQCSNERGGGDGDTRDKKLQDAIKEYNNGNLDAKQKIIDILNEYCLACKIFGSNTYASHIIFTDAYPLGNVSIGVKTGIAINRRSGAAKGGALYQVEFVNPGSIFQGLITLINPPNYVTGLILNVIENIINRSMVRIGGFKSRGFGNVNINIEGIDGMVIDDSKLKYIKVGDELKTLDEYDTNVRIVEKHELIKEFIRVWDEYVSKHAC